MCEVLPSGRGQTEYKNDARFPSREKTSSVHRATPHHTELKMLRLCAILLVTLAVGAYSAPGARYEKEANLLKELLDLLDNKAEEKEQKSSYMMMVDGNTIKVYPQTWGECDSASDNCNFDIRVFANGQQVDQHLKPNYYGSDDIPVTVPGSGTYAVQTCMVDASGNSETGMGGNYRCDCRTCVVGGSNSCSMKHNVDVANPSSAGASQCTA